MSTSTTTHPLQFQISPQRPTPQLTQTQLDEVLDARLADRDGRQTGGSVPLAELVEKARERVQPGASTCAELSCNDRNHASTCAELLQELLSNFCGNYAEELFLNFFGTILSSVGTLGLGHGLTILELFWNSVGTLGWEHGLTILELFGNFFGTLRP